MVYLLGFQGWQKQIVGKEIVCAHSKAGLWLSRHLEMSRKHGPDAALLQILWFSFEVWTIQAAGVILPSVFLPASDAAVSLANQRPVKSGFLLKSSIFVLLWSSFSKEDPCLVPLEVNPCVSLVQSADAWPKAFLILQVGSHAWRKQLNV